MKIKTRQEYVIDPDMPEQTKWLLQVMNFAKVNTREFGDRIYASRQTVSKLVHCKNKLSFLQIAGIVKIFDTGDDPEEIWRWIQHDTR